MNRLYFLLASLFFYVDGNAQPTLAEQLGYPPATKLLVIHADDLGMAHSGNAASFRALAEGAVSSASIMPPCPWMAEVADWAKENPGHDLGIHLTLTNEWKHFRRGPVAPASEVPGLVNELGMAGYYESVLRNLSPGVSVLLIHCAYDNHEFQGVAADHPEWGSAWRQADFDFFTSEQCKQMLEEENIRLVTWRELGARWQKKRLKDKIGQMLLLGFRGMSVDTSSPIIQHIEAGRVGSVILFDYDVMKKEAARNIKSPAQVKALVDSLQAYARTPLLVAIDQEGGRVLRLKPKYGFPAIPSAFYLGQLSNLDSTRYYAELNARTMASLGINLNFAPVVDLNIERDSGVIGRLERSFSDDPEVVTQQAQAVIKAHLSNGVIPVLKHFPGHGSARNDSHKGLTDVTDTWGGTELEPYRRIIEQGYEGAVMTAHVFNQRIDDKYPATLSKKAISILRDSIGYDGVIFSDDMQMEAIASEYGLEEAIVLCINAGVDVLCFGNNLGYDEEIPEKFQAIVLKAVEEGRIRPERIEEAYQRVMRLKREVEGEK